MTISLQADSTDLYQTQAQLDYQIGKTAKQKSYDLRVPVFLDDGSEQARTAKQALALYDSCKKADEKSIATQNNLGVLYRLLGETEQARLLFETAESRALTSRYSYDGIRMNRGVVHSDQHNAGYANTLYQSALSASPEVLKAALYYNLMWEAYSANTTNLVFAYADSALDFAAPDSFLQAKIRVLRGVAYFDQEQNDLARQDFQHAVELDPEGPMGRMATENLHLIAGTSADEKLLLPNCFALYANYPNPFNPSTALRFELPRPSHLELTIYNSQGQLVRRIYDGTLGAGYHVMEWTGADERGRSVGSGLYFVRMQAEEYVAVQKMTLLR